MTDSQRSSRPVRLFGILALVAAVAGAAVSWAGWGFLLPVAAIVLALVARRRDRGRRLLWILALVLGIVGLIVSAVSLFYQYLQIMAAVGFSAA